MATIYISHGDKGGVGKSVVSMFLVEALLADNKHVALVEADPTQPDLADRYAGDDGIQVGALSLNAAGDAENALSRFGDWLEASARGRDVVVNLPAGAGETLDSLGDLIAALADALGLGLTVVYSLEKNRVAADACARSFGGGLMSHVPPAGRVVAYPAYKGEPAEFAWYTHPARELSGAREIVIPRLGNSAALRKMEATPGRIARLIDKSARPNGWTVLDQMSVYRWARAGFSAITPVVMEHSTATTETEEAHQ